MGGSCKLSEKDLSMGQYARVDGDVDQLCGSNGYAIDADTGNITFDKNQGQVLVRTQLHKPVARQPCSGTQSRPDNAGC